MTTNSQKDKLNLVEFAASPHGVSVSTADCQSARVGSTPIEGVNFRLSGLCLKNLAVDRREALKEPLCLYSAPSVNIQELSIILTLGCARSVIIVRCS